MFVLLLGGSNMVRKKFQNDVEFSCLTQSGSWVADKHGPKVLLDFRSARQARSCFKGTRAKKLILFRKDARLSSEVWDQACQ